MKPNEIESADPFVICGIARIEAKTDIFGATQDSEFVANILARSGSSHRVENGFWSKELYYVLDELAGTIAGIARVSIVASPWLVIEAC